MPRKTKAEREAEAQAYREQQEAEALAAYPSRLMEALERASRLNFEINVREGKFVVNDRNDTHNTWDLSYEYRPETDADLDMLIWEITQQEAAEAEANRKWLARQAALSKLSEEERQLLGL